MPTGRRASGGNWMGMVQTCSNLEQAVAKALGGNRQLVLEASSGSVAPAPVVSPPTPKPVTPPVIPPMAPPATPTAATNPPKPQPNPQADPVPPPAPVAAAVASPKAAVEAKAPEREQPITLQAKKGPRQSPGTTPPLLISTAMRRHWQTSSTGKFWPLTTLGCNKHRVFSVKTPTGLKEWPRHYLDTEETAQIKT